MKNDIVLVEYLVKIIDKKIPIQHRGANNSRINRIARLSIKKEI